MRPSSLGGGAAYCVALSVRLSVCPSGCLFVCPSVPLSLPSVTSRHLANYNDGVMQTRYSLLIKNVTLNKLKKYKGELPNLLFHYENSHTRNVYSV